jgi:hypothetical protein
MNKLLCCHCVADMTSDKTIDFVQLLGTVVIPIIIGFITYMIAKNQIRNAGVTQFRQQWIENLRTSISDFIGKVEYLSLEIKQNNRSDQTIVDMYQDLIRLRYKIDLMLNPKEDDHKLIIEKIVTLRNGLYKPEISTTDIQNEIASLTNTTKDVLKREWTVVKKGK